MCLVHLGVKDEKCTESIFLSTYANHFSSQIEKSPRCMGHCKTEKGHDISENGTKGRPH